MRLPHKAVYGQANILSRVLHRDQYVIVCVSASLLLGLAPRHNDVAHKLGPRPRAIMDPGVREGGPAGESEPRCPLRCASKQASLRVSAPWRSQLIGSTLAAHAVRDLRGALPGGRSGPRDGRFSIEQRDGNRMLTRRRPRELCRWGRTRAPAPCPTR